MCTLLSCFIKEHNKVSTASAYCEHWRAWHGFKKSSTSSFTHHPHVSNVRAALHAHVRTLTQLATGGF